MDSFLPYRKKRPYPKVGLESHGPQKIVLVVFPYRKKRPSSSVRKEGVHNEVRASPLAYRESR